MSALPSARLDVVSWDVRWVAATTVDEFFNKVRVRTERDDRRSATTVAVRAVVPHRSFVRACSPDVTAVLTAPPQHHPLATESFTFSGVTVLRMPFGGKIRSQSQDTRALRADEPVVDPRCYGGPPYVGCINGASPSNPTLFGRSCLIGRKLVEVVPLGTELGVREK